MDEFVKKAFEQATATISTAEEAKNLFHAYMPSILDAWHETVGEETSKKVSMILSKPGDVSLAFYNMAAMFFSAGYSIGKTLQ